MQQRTLILVLFFLVISLNSFCIYRYVIRSGTPVYMNDFPVRDQLRTGDIVLRNGKGMISHWFARMSQHDPRFSHAGLVYRHDGKVSIISSTQDAIVPGIQLQDPEEFLDPGITEAYAVYRLPLEESQRISLSRLLEKDIQHPLPFDAAYDLRSDSAIYCTEYIYKRMNRIAPGQLTVSYSGDWPYIATEDLYLHNAGWFLVPPVKIQR